MPVAWVHILKKSLGTVAIPELIEWAKKYNNLDNVIHLGDYNQNMFEPKEAKIIHYFAIENRLEIQSNIATRVTKKSRTCIDLIMIKSKLKYSSKVIQTDISDHFTPILSIQAEKIKKLPPLHKREF